MSEPRLMTPEQMVNVWCLMTGASVNATQKEALINLLEECYKAGVRKGRTPEPVSLQDEMLCPECGHMFGNHTAACRSAAASSCYHCNAADGHENWCVLYDSAT